ncbi:acetyl-CoA carboxylase biotin carboxyl carrier protein subunit [Microbulbifer taiwanensis]|uniref:acetyl-CoA carboxylase biotin carboxyl carrier protein subunit n=1 Tax=Microbulbifer taiwanensis TaxID=986746 RepID=UPI00360AE765
MQWQCDALDGDIKSGEIRVLEGGLALVDGRRLNFSCVDTGDGGVIFIDGTQVEFKLLPPDIGESDDSAHGLEAPMNGTIIALLVEPGAQVEKDQPLLVMEAMKMEHTLRAPAAGTVQQFFCAEGELVDGGSLLIDFEEE